LARAIQSAAGVSLGMLPALRSWVHAQAAGDQTRDLGAGFHVLTAGQTNVLAVTGADGVALVDGASAAESSALLRMVEALPNAGQVHTLFNTHWHPEQTGSNEALGKAGATIVAHENTRLWLTTDVTWPWNNETVEPLAEVARPNKTFFTTLELSIGGQAVRCGHLRDCPHTDGDMYVFFPEQNVMAVGDAVTGAGWPSIDWWTGGWVGGLVGGLDIILTVANPATRFVPARGPVLSHAQILEQYRMYGLIWERLAQILYGGGGPEEAIAAEPTKEFNDIMGVPDEFVRRAFESLWAYLSPDA
jgi:glyoxylase-like metal-dependent hydrolase (beta-lactamase superfamily II)